jgi:hypothetical protein
MATHLAKKVVQKAKEVRGIWLNDAGTLSFGLKYHTDVPIDKETYDDLKTKSKDDRLNIYSEILKKLNEDKTEVKEENA